MTHDELLKLAQDFVVNGYSCHFSITDLEKPFTQMRVLAQAYLSLSAKLSALEANEATIENLAFQLGWGKMSAVDAYNFMFKREQLLRLAQAELETHKSNAGTPEQAIRERIRALKEAKKAERGEIHQGCKHCGCKTRTWHRVLSDGVFRGECCEACHSCLMPWEPANYQRIPAPPESK